MPGPRGANGETELSRARAKGPGGSYDARSTITIAPVGHLRRAIAACGLAAALVFALVPAAAASTSVTYTISGVEYAATSTESRFAGFAVATDDFGSWLAVVNHTELSSGSATITGGAFSYDGRVRDLSGTFITGGSLTQTGGFIGCVKETFTVIGELLLTIPAGGTGLFTATLTHYRKLIFGRCVTYAATVKGTVAFTLP